MPRWRVWAGWGSLVAAFAMAQFHRVSPAAMGDAVMTDLGIGAGSFGLIVAMYFYSYAGLMIPGGALADRYGPRWVASIGCAVAALGAGLVGAAQSPWSAMLGRLLIGGGVAAAFPCVLRFQSDWLPPRMYGALTGVVVGTTTIASLVAFTPLALLVQAAGWRHSQTVIVAATLVVAIMVWALVQDSGGSSAATALRTSMGQSWAGVWSGVREVMGNWRSWPPFLVQFGNYGGLIALAGTWAVPYLMSVHGMTLVTASTYAQIPLIGMSIGGPATGWISDRLRSRRMPALLLGLVLVACWAWLVVLTPPQEAVMPLLFVMGLAGGVIVTTLSVVSEVNPPELTGVASALVATGGMAGAAVIQPIMGWLLDSFGAGPAGFRIGFVPGLLGAVVAAVASLFLVETRGRS